MNIMIVDDEPLSLGDLINVVGSVTDNSRIEGFSSAEEAMEYVKTNSVDVAFLDITMPEISGIQLAQSIREKQENTNIIFVTAYPDYALEAHKMYVAGYLMKPATKEDIITALNNLRFPLNKDKKNIKVRTFGGFDVFVNGEPVPFGRSKAKELLAYLVDRKGFTCSTQQIISTLWDGENFTATQKSHLRNIIAQMLATLKKAGAEEIIIKSYNSLAVDTSKFTCDYYDFLEKKPEGLNRYTREYMCEYSWAEFTLGVLEERMKVD